MRGLLIKDLCLMKNMKYFLSIIALITLSSLYFNLNQTFAIGFSTFMVSIFTLTSISYDEFDKGFSFLFTLPVSRKLYVAEKYIFCLLTSGCTCIIVTFLMLLFGGNHIAEGNVFIATALAKFLSNLIILALILPIQFKFGAEKLKLIILSAVGVTFLIALYVEKGMQYKEMDLNDFLTRLDTLNPWSMVGAFAMVYILLFLISYLVSMNIMEKKQF